MARQQAIVWLTAWLLIMTACGDDILGPGDVALPLVGTYLLESRSFVAQDSARTVLTELTPPEIRSSLKLTDEGRYAQVDTLNISEQREILTAVGRWSVLNNQFFMETDGNRIFPQLFTFDGTTLTLITPDLQGNDSVPSGFFDVIDVWRKIRNN